MKWKCLHLQLWLSCAKSAMERPVGHSSGRRVQWELHHLCTGPLVISGVVAGVALFLKVKGKVSLRSSPGSGLSVDAHLTWKKIFCKFVAHTIAVNASFLHHGVKQCKISVS